MEARGEQGRVLHQILHAVSQGGGGLTARRKV